MFHHHLTTRATLILSWIVNELPESYSGLLSDPGYMSVDRLNPELDHLTAFGGVNRKCRLCSIRGQPVA